MPTPIVLPPTRPGRLLAVVIPLGLLLWLAQFTVEDAAELTWEPLLDLVLGVAAIVLMVFRWRAPFLAAVLCVTTAAGSGLALPAAVVSYVSLVTTRRWAAVAATAGIGVLTGTLWEVLVAEPDIVAEWWVVVVLLVVYSLALTGIGLYVITRRELAAARLARARAQERTRIAHEMHDVLAHRISLVALHAGAMSYRTDLTPDELRGAAHLVQENARLALTDLRDVLGVLRDPAFGGSMSAGTEPPQPTLADLPALASEASALGPVSVRDDRAQHDVPETVGRTAYRIVQEGLTNARKHAPGAPVQMRLSGAPGGMLAIEISNPVLTPSTSGLPGAGVGLHGLQERTSLLGGRIWHGVTSEATFCLRAELPWGRA